MHSAPAILWLLFAAAGAGAAFSGCTSKPSAPGGPAELAARGRAIYQSNCIACHNSDPRKPGSVGPDVQGATRALLEARILRQEYPQGYAPKRPTHVMPALPQVRNELDALAAFLR